MKHLFVYSAFTFLFFINTTSAQDLNRSQKANTIGKAPVSAVKNKISYTVDELVSLGKCWGFLKYYHPSISQGKLSWDSLLISTLTHPKQPISAVINNWIKVADQVKISNTRIVNEAYDSVDARNVRLNWIKKDRYLSEVQKQLFLKLSKVEEPIGTYYSKNDRNTYSAKNEKDYSDTTLAYRLLGLYRFWNAIEYFYPYKYAIGKPWDEVLKNFVVKAQYTEDNVGFARFIAGLANSINDTHATIDPPVNELIYGKLGAPFKFKVVENTVVITKIVDAAVCKKNGLEVGDLITKINSQSIKSIIDSKSRFISSSNESVKIRDAFFYLFNANTTEVTVQGFKKNGSALNTVMTRVKRNYLSEWDKEGNPDNKLVYYDEKAKKLVYARILENNIGYIDRSSIVNAEIDSIMQSMMHTKGLIFDLRGYAEGSGSLKPFNYLLPKPFSYGKMSQPDFSRPGYFGYVDYILSTPDVKIKTIGKENPQYYKGKVIVLINEGTQSAEELWAMLYQTIPGVIVIGSQTAGADGNQTAIKVIGGYSIYMSGLGIFYPNGKETQRIGIVPNIMVKPSIKDMQEQKDVLVAKALKILNK